MLCQLCTRNAALVKAGVGSNTVHICIPCALKIMEDDPETTLELERRTSVQEMEKGQVEEED